MKTIFLLLLCIVAIESKYNGNVKNIYVARREIKNVPFRYKDVAHSGILATTNDKKAYIVHYGIDKKSVVTTERVSYDKINKNDFVDSDNKKWHKQSIGSTPNSPLSIDDLTNTMKKVTENTEYNLIKSNCHDAQENTRKSLGLFK